MVCAPASHGSPAKIRRTTRRCMGTPEGADNDNRWRRRVKTRLGAKGPVIPAFQINGSDKNPADSRDRRAYPQGRVTTGGRIVFMSGPQFVHLRFHSEFSVVDGIVRVDDAVERAAAD